jgi:cell division protein FtsW
MLLILSTVLLVIGLVVVYAISPGLSEQRHVSENYFISKQVIAILLGVVAFAITANTPLSRWKHFLKPLAIVAGVATLIALVTPVTPEYPAHRWIRMGGLSLQSVELVKLALLLGLSFFLADRQRHGELDNK